MKRLAVAVAAAAVVVAAATLTGPAWAANLTVTTAEDERNTNGECSLREAILNANDNERTSPDCSAGSGKGTDTIVFRIGQSATIELGSQLPVVTDIAGLAIDGGAANTAVSGENKVQVFNIDSDARLTLANLTVANGKVADTSGGISTGASGGGIYNQGKLKVIRSTISGNSADRGGGIYNSGKLAVIRSTIFGNSVSLLGGGIENWGTLSVRNSTLSGNAASGLGTFAGGVWNVGTLEVKRSTISENSADLGGGINNIGTLNVIRSILSGNHDSGIYNTGTLGLRRSTLYENGTGMENNDMATVTNSTFSGNDVGIYTTGTTRVLSSTLYENSTGINNSPPAPGLAMTSLQNTIVANSSSGSNCHGPITDAGHNLDSSTSCVTERNSLSNAQPLLGPLENNGGPTPTHALLEGSPALGKGFFEEKIDQRGEKRPSHAGCADIGAFEERDPQKQPPFLIKSDFYEVNEDNELRVTAPGLLANDCDSNDKPASAAPGAQEPTHGTLSREADGSFNYDPHVDFYGKDPFTYSVTGSNGATVTATVDIYINSVNDAPSFQKGPDQSVDEDSGKHTVVGWATGISPGPANESGQSVNFIASSNDGALFASDGQPAVDSNGTLTYTPEANASGTATVTVTAKDDGGTANGGVDESAEQEFRITINPVND